MLIIGTGSNGRTISSVTSYFARNGSLFLRSLSAAKSSGESEGTDVTTPVPICKIIMIKTEIPYKIYVYSSGNY